MRSKITSVLFFSLLLATLISCGKKCGECPEGMHLSVDEPKEKNCICCPNGQEYNAALGHCE